jgi:hypothetical protein
MKWLVGLLIICGGAAEAHDVYVSQARLSNAIKAVYSGQSPKAGFSGDCFSCHSNIPALKVGFGSDFKIASDQVAAGQLTQQQLQTVVQNLNLRQLDSDGDADTNETEFRNGTDPGDRNSNSQNPNPTTTTTTLKPPPIGSGGGGNPVNKFSGNNPEGNYLQSGCGSMTQASVSNDWHWQAAFPISALILMPIGLALGLRRRK